MLKKVLRKILNFLNRPKRLKKDTLYIFDDTLVSISKEGVFIFSKKNSGFQPSLLILPIKHMLDNDIPDQNILPFEEGIENKKNIDFNSMSNKELKGLLNLYQESENYEVCKEIKNILDERGANKN